MREETMQRMTDREKEFPLDRAIYVGVEWPERATNPQKAAAIARAYSDAWALDVPLSSRYWRAYLAALVLEAQGHVVEIERPATRARRERAANVTSNVVELHMPKKTRRK